MTLLGKIFTVLIFIMSILFMGFAVVVCATHTNWREKVENQTVTATAPLGLKYQLQQEVEKNARLTAEFERLRDRLAIEMAARRSALASLQSKLDQVSEQLRIREASLAESQANLNKALTAENVTVENLQRLTAEVTKLRDEIRTVQNDRDQKFMLVVQLTDELNQRAGTLQMLQERRDQLVDQLAKQKLVMDAHGLDINTPVFDLPPKVDGYVTAVSNDRLIEVSIGSDDGLRPGNTLEVFRNNSYLGRVIIRKTGPDRSVAEILPKWQKGRIKVDDRVATKLSG